MNITHHTIVYRGDKLYICPSGYDDDGNIDITDLANPLPVCCMTHAQQLVATMDEALLNATLVEDMTLQIIEMATKIEELESRPIAAGLTFAELFNGATDLAPQAEFDAYMEEGR